MSCLAMTPKPTVSPPRHLDPQGPRVYLRSSKADALDHVHSIIVDSRLTVARAQLSPPGCGDRRFDERGPVPRVSEAGPGRSVLNFADGAEKFLDDGVRLCIRPRDGLVPEAAIETICPLVGLADAPPNRVLVPSRLDSPAGRCLESPHRRLGPRCVRNVH